MKPNMWHRHTHCATYLAEIKDTELLTFKAISMKTEHGMLNTG